MVETASQHSCLMFHFCGLKSRVILPGFGPFNKDKSLLLRKLSIMQGIDMV